MFWFKLIPKASFISPQINFYFIIIIDLFSVGKKIVLYNYKTNKNQLGGGTIEK